MRLWFRTIVVFGEITVALQILPSADLNRSRASLAVQKQRPTHPDNRVTDTSNPYEAVVGRLIAE